MAHVFFLQRMFINMNFALLLHKTLGPAAMPKMLMR